MSDILVWIVGYAAFVVALVLLYQLITRLARSVLGPRRRLEEQLGETLLRGRLKRGEISRDEFNQALHAMTDIGERSGR